MTSNDRGSKDYFESLSEETYLLTRLVYPCHTMPVNDALLFIIYPLKSFDIDIATGGLEKVCIFRGLV